jgi:hypothetical protein
MIVNRANGLIFVHAWKTGGTSVAAALRDAHVGDDRSGSARLQRFGHVSLRHRPMRVRLGKHAHAVDIRRAHPGLFDRSYSFGFVRNPWDWLVSWYLFVTEVDTSPDHGGPWRHHLADTISAMSFEDFVSWVADDGLCQAQARRNSSFRDVRPFAQLDWYSDLNGNCIVDRIGRYEELEPNFAAICEQAGIDAALPRRNVNEHAHYREYYDEATRRTVASYFARDIERFDYEF